VALLFWRRAALPLRAAALLAATLLAVPVLLLYDLMLLAVAGAWLIVAARGAGLRAGERAVLVAGYALPLVSRPIGLAVGLGLSPLLSIAVLAAVMRRDVAR